jgi:hypothetical protein
VSGDQRTRSRVHPRTLLIAAVASATAAVVIPMLWRPGTVFAAAMTPVIVAIVSEMLNRPVERVNAVRVRRTAEGTALLDRPQPEPDTDPDEPFDPLAPAPAGELLELSDGGAAPRTQHGRRPPLTARQWKLGLATGLAAFLIAAGVVTAVDIVTGDAVSGGGRTTFFGGHSSKSSESEGGDAAKQSDKPDQQKDPSASATPTPQPAAGATPTPTPTPAASATPTPVPTGTPAPSAATPTPAP